MYPFIDKNHFEEHKLTYHNFIVLWELKIQFFYLRKSNELAGDVARMPGHGEAPDDVGEHADEADAEICWHHQRQRDD